MYKDQDLIFFDFETTGIRTSCDDDPDYPIEIGMVFCDDKLLIKDLFQSYILWPWMEQLDKWPSAYDDAYAIHKINLNKIVEYGLKPEELTKDMNILIDKNCNKNRKPTLVSDNAYFDTFMMHRLYNRHGDFPFHYTTWDINILYVPLGVKKPRTHTHSALEDALNMHHRTIRALEKINYFG